MARTGWPGSSVPMPEDPSPDPMEVPSSVPRSIRSDRPEDPPRPVAPSACPPSMRAYTRCVSPSADVSSSDTRPRRTVTSSSISALTLSTGLLLLPGLSALVHDFLGAGDPLFELDPDPRSLLMASTVSSIESLFAVRNFLARSSRGGGTRTTTTVASSCNPRFVPSAASMIFSAADLTSSCETSRMIRAQSSSDTTFHTPSDATTSTHPPSGARTCKQNTTSVESPIRKYKETHPLHLRGAHDVWRVKVADGPAHRVPSRVGAHRPDLHAVASHPS